jgi:hypothetical protein
MNTELNHESYVSHGCVLLPYFVDTDDLAAKSTHIYIYIVEKC